MAFINETEDTIIKKLLANDGVIFVQIDDKYFAHLRLIY